MQERVSSQIMSLDVFQQGRKDSPDKQQGSEVVYS